MSDFDFEARWRRTRKLFEEIDKLFDEIFREIFETERRGETRRVYGPYFYGFSVTIGPDGVPHIREWGNIKPGMIKPRITETIEPLTDVIEEDDVYKIVLDIPGVEKEKINVEATEDTIIVSASNEDRKYYKEIKLEKKIKPETARAKYKNGVLTITVEKAVKEKRKKGFTVKVE